MADVKATKSFKLTQETIDKLQAVNDAAGLNWDDTFMLLTNLYAQSVAAQALPGRETEIRNFQAHLNALSQAFTSALQINADTDARIRDEYAARLTSAEEATASMTDKIKQAQDAMQKADERAKALSDELEQAKHDAETKITDLTRQVESITSQLQDKADALRDKDRINQSLAAQLTSQQKQVEVARTQAEDAAKRMEEFKATNESVEAELAKAIKRAEAAEETIRVQKAQNEIDRQKAILDTREAEQAKHEAKVDALNAKIQELYEKLEAKGKKKPRTLKTQDNQES